ncbi:MAG: hypothetical protein JWN44_6183 [Myxococcales bacterium]|nr:hypothetical protein [Myxococcales bacterium]
MGRTRAKSMSSLLQELHTCSSEQEKEIGMLRATVERLRGERDELLAQLRFANEQANRETRAAGSLRAQLLSRTSIPKERLDFCCAGDGGETTAVLPRPRIAPRGRVRDDDTERSIRQ